MTSVEPLGLCFALYKYVHSTGAESIEEFAGGQGHCRIFNRLVEARFIPSNDAFA
jgi:hypothetical protein